MPVLAGDGRHARDREAVWDVADAQSHGASELKLS